MYIYNPKKKLKSKDKYLKKSSNKDKNKYLKQQNLNLSDITSNSIYNLQNKIGNKQTEILLRELGDMEIQRNNSKDGQLKKHKDNPHNETMETNKEIQDFKDLSYTNSLQSYDAVKSGRFSVKHNEQSKPQVKSSVLDNNIKGLIQMVNFFKCYDPRLDKREEKVKLDDKLMNKIEKNNRNEVDLIIKMIMALPSYNGNDQIISLYMKVQNFLISSGCNLKELFKYNGDVKKQKEIIFKSIEGR